MKAYLFCFEIILEKYLLLGEDSVNILYCAVFSTFLCDMIWRVKWIIGWKLDVQFVLNSSFYLIAWFFFQGQDRQVSWLPWWWWRRICCHIQGERSFGGNCRIWFPLRSQVSVRNDIASGCVSFTSDITLGSQNRMFL